mmetsp:Transcript_24569/g.29772  ORF Transcript_24569/g.29772 Transcript_24569/m.29772 type:complete len:85 (+) Transcript_24569:31-285(+)
MRSIYVVIPLTAVVVILSLVTANALDYPNFDLSKANEGIKQMCINEDLRWCLDSIYGNCHLGYEHACETLRMSGLLDDESKDEL